MNRLVGLSS